MLTLDRISSSPQLPTLPAVAKQLLDLVGDPDATIGAVVSAIKTDPALAAKLVKAANSSYFGMRSEVRGVDRAVSLLGTTTSISMALNFALADDSMKEGPVSQHYRNYWRQSIVQASAAECLGQLLPAQDHGELFLVGLLMDIGRLAMLKSIPADYTPILDRAEAEGLTLSDAEMESLGFSHVTVGCRLLENMKLPKSLVNACAARESSLPELLALPDRPVFLLHGGAAFAAAVGDYYCTAAKGASLERMRGLLPELLGAGAPELETFLKDCERRIEQTSHLFDIDLQDLGSSTELMVLANEQLLQLTLREHVSNTQLQLRQEALSEEKHRLEEQNLALQSRCSHDALTGLFNRNYFEDALKREAARCQRMAAPIAVIFADVDHFKTLNDTYGHAFGDHVLREIAERFRSAVRASDVLARYGGEELVILVHQPAEKGLQTLAERICEKVAAAPFELGDLSIYATCSVGAALVIPARSDQNVGQRLVAVADQAMYQAKNSGRNCAVVQSLVAESDRQLQQQVTSGRFSRWLVQKQLLGIADVSRALLECPTPAVRIGELAEQLGFLNAAQTLQVLQQQQAATDERFGELAIRLGLLEAPQLVQLLTLQAECPRQLTTAIVRMGLLAPDVAATALDSYSEEQRASIPQPLKC